MKKILLIFILALLLPSCDKDSGGGSDTSFRVKPGGLTKFESPVITYAYSYAGFGPGNAIIYNGVISGTNYIGLALGDDNDDSFGLYIYFPRPTFPTSFPTTINVTSTPGFVIKARNSITEYTGVTGTLNLIFEARNEGTYVTYTIKPDTPGLQIGGQPVTFTGLTITALFVGTNP